MSHLARLLVVLVAMLTGLVAVASPASAVGNPEAATRAAGYIASQKEAASADVGQASESLFALAGAADEARADDAKALLDVVTKGAGEYAKTPEGAAKLALVADVYGLDPKNVGGVDTIAPILAGVKSDGSYGQYPGPYASGLAMVAIARTGNAVPQSMIDYLAGKANSDGGFTYETGQPSDADNTGMAILGLAAVKDAPGAQDALARAQAWATSTQTQDGSWAGYNKINSTAIMGSALQSTGQPQQKAVDFLVSQQADDGSMPGDGDKPNLLATQQAALLLGDTSYADVNAPAAWKPAAADSTASPNAPATPEGNGGVNPLVWIAAALVALGLLGFFLTRGRRGRQTVADDSAADHSETGPTHPAADRPVETRRGRAATRPPHDAPDE